MPRLVRLISDVIVDDMGDHGTYVAALPLLAGVLWRLGSRAGQLDLYDEVPDRRSYKQSVKDPHSLVSSPNYA